MPNPWESDIDISPELVADLIDRQFRELAPARVESFGTGWDSLAVLVNEQFVFRFLRRKIAADLIDRDTRVLPQLAMKNAARYALTTTSQ